MPAPQRRADSSNALGHHGRSVRCILGVRSVDATDDLRCGWRRCLVPLGTRCSAGSGIANVADQRHQRLGTRRRPHPCARGSPAVGSECESAARLSPARKDSEGGDICPQRFAADKGFRHPCRCVVSFEAF